MYVEYTPWHLIYIYVIPNDGQFIKMDYYYTLIALLLVSYTFCGRLVIRNKVIFPITFIIQILFTFAGRLETNCWDLLHNTYIIPWTRVV